MLQRIESAVDHRLGKFDLGNDVCQVVLHGLKAANGLVELLALSDIVHRQIQHALGQTQHLCRSSQRAALACGIPDLLALRTIKHTRGV